MRYIAKNTAMRGSVALSDPTGNPSETLLDPLSPQRPLGRMRARSTRKKTALARLAARTCLCGH